MEGAGGGAAGTDSGGVGEEGLGSIPLPQPHPPNRPLPHPQHLVHAGEVPVGQIPSNVQGLLGGGWRPGVWCWAGGVCVGGRESKSEKEPPAAHPWSRGGQATHGGGWWPPSPACPPAAAQRCPSAPPPTPPGPSPPAPPPGSPLTSGGSYSRGTPRCPCCWGGAPRGGWRRRCGGAAAHSPHSPQ